MIERNFHLTIARPFICKECREEIITGDVIYIVEPAQTVPLAGGEVAKVSLFHEEHAPVLKTVEE